MTIDCNEPMIIDFVFPASRQVAYAGRAQSNGELHNFHEQNRHVHLSISCYGFLFG